MSILNKFFLAGALLCGGAANAETPTTVPTTPPTAEPTLDIAAAEPNTTVTTTTTTTTKDGVTTTTTITVRTTTKARVTPDNPALASGPVVIPFKLLSSGHIAIMAKINGKGPYRFIFDTGAPTLVISERVARAAGILPKDFHKPFFTPLGNLGEFNVKSVEVGLGRQDGLSTSVWNHPTVELIAKTEGPLEGLIGFPFFAHYDLKIDYKALTLTLTPSAYQPVDMKEQMMALMSGQSVAKPPLITEPLGLKFDKPAGDSAAGVKVTDVYAHGPAAAAGIKAGDRLLTLDGRWTDTAVDCAAAASAISKPGAYAATVFRDGKVVTLSIKVSPGI
jgi:hypothetical protein